MKVLSASIIILFMFLSGCETIPKQPTLTPLEIQSLQTREFENDIDIVFPSVISVFQDLGYTVKSADRLSGLITADGISISDAAMKLWLGITSVEQTSATAFVERIGSVTRVRLSFVKEKTTSSSYGQTDRQDTQILNAQIYQNAFNRVEDAIFIRAAN